MEHELVCQVCGEAFPPGNYRTGCPTCYERDDAGWLQVEYDTADVTDAFPLSLNAPN